MTEITEATSGAMMNIFCEYSSAVPTEAAILA